MLYFDNFNENNQLFIGSQYIGILFIVTFIFTISFVYLQPQILVQIFAKRHRDVLWYAETDENVCSLTIDDAPSSSTEYILDILLQYNIKATFFIISDNVRGKEYIVQRMVEEGHSLGNHLTEDKASIRYNLNDFEKKLLECDIVLKSFQKETIKSNDNFVDRSYIKQNEINQINHEKQKCLHPIKWVRPGSGWFNNDMKRVIKEHQYRICLGNVYPHDAQIRYENINEFFLRKRTRKGCIIVIHDRSWTIGVLKKSLPDLSKRFTFVSLNELEKLNNLN